MYKKPLPAIKEPFATCYLLKQEKTAKQLQAGLKEDYLLRVLASGI